MHQRVQLPSAYPQLSGELFEHVQANGVFTDSKTFPDSRPTTPPKQLYDEFARQRGTEGFDLHSFINEHFELPATDPSPSASESPSLAHYIDNRWASLTRDPAEINHDHDTTIDLPYPSVIAGGRFREIYYWDTYFVAEALATTGRRDQLRGLVENFAYLIDTYGFIPTGTRRYYLTRSQPPLFYRMLQVLEDTCGTHAVEPYLPALRTEYDFWMHRPTSGDTDPAVHRTVALDDTTVLNRYWDVQASPRPEAYQEDHDHAQSLPEREREQFFRDVRAACESGWDFSSRWLATPDDFTSIQTTALVPVDLNTYLYELERSLSHWYRTTDAHAKADRFKQAAQRRQQALTTYCWDDNEGMFTDYNWRTDEQTRPTVAGVAPLFTGAATAEQACAVADTLADAFLEPGGLVTTVCVSGEQWDAPHGWAPLQWLAVRGLERYGHHDLAETIATRWVDTVEQTYEDTGVVFEKYDVVNETRAKNYGEYPVQVGFGWTNAVTQCFQQQYNLG